MNMNVNANMNPMAVLQKSKALIQETQLITSHWLSFLKCLFQLSVIQKQILTVFSTRSCLPLSNSGHIMFRLFLPWFIYACETREMHSRPGCVFVQSAIQTW